MKSPRTSAMPCHSVLREGEEGSEDGDDDGSPRNKDADASKKHKKLYSNICLLPKIRLMAHAFHLRCI